MRQVIIAGEGVNQMQIQRDLFDKIYLELANVNVSEITVNVAVGSMLMDLYECDMYTRSEEETAQIHNEPTKRYLICLLNGINVFVDPMMQWGDTRVIAEGIEVTIDMDPSMLV